MRFERSFQQPGGLPNDGAFAHFSSYELETKGSPFSHWTRGKTVARWKGVELEEAAAKPEPVWHSLATSPNVEVLSKSPGGSFGLSVTIRRARDTSPPNLTALVKPLFDGIVASFHHHDGSDIQELSNRVSGTLGVEPSEIRRLLENGSRAVLGERTLLWRRAGGVQWNPGDDACVAGELLSDRTSGDASYSMSGEIFAVLPMRESNVVGGISNA